MRVAIERIAEDPFVTLLIGGFDLGALVQSIRRDDRTVVDERFVDVGMAAAEAFGDRAATSAIVLPPPPRVAGAARAPAPLPPVDSGVDAESIRALIADAAARAVAVTRGRATTSLELTTLQDLVRRTAEGHAEARAALAAMSSTDTEVEAAVMAWRIAGVDGLSALTESWDAPRALLEAAAEMVGRRGRVSANRVSLGDWQLRVDRSGRWWRLRADDRLGWVLASVAFDDPVEAFAAEDPSAGLA